MLFLDANLLVSFLIKSHPAHDRAHSFMVKILTSGEKLFISPQIIGETFRTTTQIGMFKDRLNATRFREIVSPFFSDDRFTMISPATLSTRFALDAAVQKNISSAKIYDLLIYGTMRENNISRIATFNEKDFRNLEGIELVKIP